MSINRNYLPQSVSSGPYQANVSAEAIDSGTQQALPLRNRRLLLLKAASPILAVVVGIACQELILKLSIPSSNVITAEQPAPELKTEAPPQVEATSLPQAELPAAPIPVPRRPQCTSQYFAVFQTASGTQCARNPTLIMAHWGPPTAEWFRTRGGRFAATPTDLVPQELCSCLMPREAYSSATIEGSIRPVRYLDFDGQNIEIEKWVCGDDCTPQVEIAANDH